MGQIQGVDARNANINEDKDVKLSKLGTYIGKISIMGNTRLSL